MVDFRQLRYFRAVADELHFARAAARLGIEQSPLSRQIQSLEADLKVRLFERTRRSTWLTAAGERFALDARRILADVDASVLAVRAFAQAGQVLRLGLSEGFASAAFGGLLRACETAEPRLPIILMERPLAEMSRLTIDGGLDAMLAPEKAATPELESHVAWTEGLTLLTPLTGDCHHGGAIWLKSMGDGPWILPDPQTLPGFARQTEDLLASKSLKVLGSHCRQSGHNDQDGSSRIGERPAATLAGGDHTRGGHAPLARRRRPADHLAHDPARRSVTADRNPSRPGPVRSRRASFLCIGLQHQVAADQNSDRMARACRDGRPDVEVAPRQFLPDLVDDVLAAIARRDDDLPVAPIGLRRGELGAHAQ
ncbi:MAG: LysR family transcriptional regulator [Phenylobacterium sp.]|nr:LysR family transcriptional regulator [Phenylobacterium sp.]MDP3852205.1 LysR family transcriptional regulator [Phenylobacterium sp.]